MAKHEVSITLPKRWLGKADTELGIYQDGKALGKLAVSNGSIVWFPSGTTYGHKMKWAQFDEMMKANAKRSEKR